MKRFLLTAAVLCALASPAGASWRIWCWSPHFALHPLAGTKPYATWAVCTEHNEASDANIRGDCVRGNQLSCDTIRMVHCHCEEETP